MTIKYSPLLHLANGMAVYFFYQHDLRVASLLFNIFTNLSIFYASIIVATLVFHPNIMAFCTLLSNLRGIQWARLSVDETRAAYTKIFEAYTRATELHSFAF